MLGLRSDSFPSNFNRDMTNPRLKHIAEDNNCGFPTSTRLFLYVIGMAMALLGGLSRWHLMLCYIICNRRDI